MEDIDPRNVSKLSPELIELIFEALADIHAEDPALHWTRGRSVTASQRRWTEQYFYNYWLPDLCVTLYAGGWSSTEFHLKSAKFTPSKSPPMAVRFARQKIQSQIGGEPTNAEVKDAWDRYDQQNPNVHIKLGGRKLDNPPISTPLINDSELIDLCVSGNGQEITFNWRKTLTAFFEEEFYIRRKKEERAGWTVATNYAFCAFQRGRIRQLLWACM